MALRFELTTLSKPASGATAATPISILGRILQFQDAEVGIPIMDQRTAKLTISMYDPILAKLVSLGHVDADGNPLLAYATMLRVWYDYRPDAPTFWGAISVPEFNYGDGTITLNAVDRGLSLENHFLRLGDTALDAANGFQGLVPPDTRGLRMLRDAGLNTVAQNARFMPDLGIKDGPFTSIDMTDSANWVKLDRGDQVWQRMKDVGGLLAGSEWELDPIDDLYDYAQLNCFDFQGQDRSNSLIFQSGFGKNNCTIDHTPGGKLYTHAHVLSSDGVNRETSVDVDSSNLRGAYVYWDATNYTAGHSKLLKARADMIVGLYGVPPDYATITLPPDPETDIHYWDSFSIGDIVNAQAKRGFCRAFFLPRVMNVRLTQKDAANNTQCAIDVVPYEAIGTPSEDA